MDALHITTAVALVCVMATSYLSGMEDRGDDRNLLHERKLVASTLRSCGAISFPSLLFVLIPSEDRACEACFAPILWMGIVTLVDSYLLFRSPSSDPTLKPASIRMDPGCVSGITFGICAYLGARGDHRYGNLFLYAVLVCVTCVLPSHNLQPGCLEAQLIESLQKTALFACIGLLVAGVSLTRSMHDPRRVA